MVASGFGTLAIAIVVSVVVASALIFVLFRAMWRVAEPNVALILSGFRQHGSPSGASVGESMGFKIVTGHGTFVIPGVQVVRKLSLDLNEAELVVDCVTQQGIPVHIKAVVIYKVGDDFVSIANAARRFLDQQDKMDTRIQNVFAGHLRAICGSLTVEELIRHRDGKARARDRLVADPRHRRSDGLHREHGQTARGRDPQGRAHRRRARGPRGDGDGAVVGRDQSASRAR
jgi:uncharacterized membrane protein YqiK